MSRIREVTVFSLGDATKLSTWSNVPYFFTETLASQGVLVNRVDLSPRIWSKALNRLLLLGFKLVGSDTTFDYTRSLLHYWETRRRIAIALRRHPDADANIFLTFSFSSSGLSDIPVVLFADWTYEHCVKHFRTREPDRMERGAINRENCEIEAAQQVFVLFPRIAEYMRSRYKNQAISYLGNVVNALVEVDAAEATRRKSASMSLLFIGGKKYVEGARRLISAYITLKPSLPNLSLTIVGMTRHDLPGAPAAVRFFGYLDKGCEKDRETYYELLLEARAIVNTTPKWGAFSAMIEAMHFYTPVIVTPYEEFVRTFGSEIDFGAYCDDDKPNSLVQALEFVLRHPDPSALCHRAHEAVKDFTWTAYIKRMVSTLEQSLGETRSASAQSEAWRVQG